MKCFFFLYEKIVSTKVSTPFFEKEGRDDVLFYEKNRNRFGSIDKNQQEK